VRFVRRNQANAWEKDTLQGAGALIAVAFACFSVGLGLIIYLKL